VWGAWRSRYICRVFASRLNLLNFKNYGELNLEFSPRLNCFTGRNGQGKTNILDALYYLSYCKSFFNPSDSQNVKTGAQFFLINGHYNHCEKNEEISCAFEIDAGKRFKRNKKEYERLADHIGLIPLVMSCPGDILLILEGSETRRRFMDSFLAQFDRPYLEHLLRYQKTVAHRNALLKKCATQKPDYTLLDALDAKLIEYGTPLYERRSAFATDFTPVFNECYVRIAGNDEKVSLNYISQLARKSLAELLREHQGRDIQTGYTGMGLHKDDLEFMLDGRPLKRVASQGQQKTFLVALRFAQALYSAQQNKVQPILLLDDIFDKLDETRVEAIIRLVHDTDFGQIFITDTDHRRMVNILDRIGREYRIFDIQNGIAS
jgi:DNA replication and repair protein RecF